MIRHNNTRLSILDLMCELDALVFQEHYGQGEFWNPTTTKGQGILETLLDPSYREELKDWYADRPTESMNIVAQQLKRTLEHLSQEKF